MNVRQTGGNRLLCPATHNFAFDVVVNNALDREYWSFFAGRTAPPGVPRQRRVTVAGSF